MGDAADGGPRHDQGRPVRRRVQRRAVRAARGGGLLREVRKRPRTGETVTLSAADPLNLAGIVLPGPRVPALATNSVTYTDGALTGGGGVDGHRHAVTSADGTESAAVQSDRTLP